MSRSLRFAEYKILATLIYFRRPTVTSYGIFHFDDIYFSFKLFYFPWEVPWEVLWGPLGGSGRVLWGPLGAHRDGLPVGMRSLRSRGDPNRQPTGNPSLQMLY